jgi:hypothetical protein
MLKPTKNNPTINIVTNESIQMPSTISSLPSSCLCYKNSLTNISFAETIATTEIPSSFCTNSSNTAFTDLIIPEGIETIGRNAFAYCKSLKNITLPSTLTYINYDAFYEGYGANNLNKVFKIKAKEPPRLYNSSVLANTSTNISKIIVPKDCLDKYKKASNWSSYASKMEESTEW